MASISKTSVGTYKVQFYENKRKRSKTFKTKSEAKQFAALLELSPEQRSNFLLFSDVIQEYKQSVTVKKKGKLKEELRLSALLRHPLFQERINEITTASLQDYVEKRSVEIAPATVIREFSLIRAVFTWAVKKEYAIKNPATGVVLPRPPEHRERVANADDIARLLQCCGWDGDSIPLDKTQLVVLAFLFGCATGMRAGEILQLEKSWIDHRVIHLPKEATKTNARRDVALSNRALELLDFALKYNPDTREERVFACLSDGSRDALFRKIRDRAGLGPVVDSHGRVIKEGLNFHDSRATFATWAASPNPKTGAPRLDVLALARQTGHKNLKMLMKYYRESAENIADRLSD